jgi:uncharacterized protein YggE
MKPTQVSKLKLALLTVGGVAVGAGGFALYGAVAARAAPASSAVTTSCSPGSPRVTVQGYGTAEGTPDELNISIGVQTQSPSALSAMKSNAAKANALIARLQADGVPKRDLQTSGLSVQPVYDNSGQLIIAYQVSNTLTVTLETAGDFAEAGKVIDDAAHAAGNALRVDNISFAVKDEAALLARARSAAVRQAGAQALVLAGAAGVALGPLCSLQDNTQPNQGPPPVVFAALPAAAHSTPVEPGTEEVTADVTAVYQLGPAPTPGAPGTS